MLGDLVVSSAENLGELERFMGTATENNQFSGSIKLDSDSTGAIGITAWACSVELSTLADSAPAEKCMLELIRELHNKPQAKEFSTAPMDYNQLTDTRGSYSQNWNKPLAGQNPTQRKLIYLMYTKPRIDCLKQTFY